MAGGRKPRSTPTLIADTFRLYRRYPLLFLTLGAGVVAPYQVIVLAATGTGQFTRSSLSAGASLALSLLDLFVVDPLISALHVHAVSDVQQDVEPRLMPVARRGFAALPVVSATAIMSLLGIFGGTLLLVVPGLILWVRWVVAVQAAAIEREGWTRALGRSWSLTEGNAVHVIVFFVCVGLISGAPSFLISRAFVDQPTDFASFAAGTIVQTLVLSFTALATALLYYDLRTRREPVAAEPPGATPSPTSHSLDPRRYSDENRPSGWYVDPDSPHRMRYWNPAADPPGWHGSTRVPRKLRREWRAMDE